MILTQHGINSLPSSTEIFFEFISSVLPSDVASHLQKITKDGIEYEYFDSSLSTVAYAFGGSALEVEFDVYWNSDIYAVLFGIGSVTTRPHYQFYSREYPPLLTRYGRNGYDAISFPSYSDLSGAYYQERSAGSPLEYCKAILSSSSTDVGKKHYKYEFLDAETVRITVTYGANESASAVLTYAAPVNATALNLVFESARHRTDFAFKNFRILCK